MDTLLEALLDRPDLVKNLDYLKRFLAHESKRRLRFYEEMNESQKTEFINGEVIVHSPAKWRHIEASDLLFRLLSVYGDLKGLGRACHEKLLVSLTRNDYEPDVCFFGREVAAGFTPTQMQFPAPTFVAEVLSPSTERNDRRLKKYDYAAHGVAEYWIVDADEQTIEQHVLRGEEFELVGTWSGDDKVSSTAVTGFTIPARTVFERPANLAALAALNAPASDR